MYSFHISKRKRIPTQVKYEYMKSITKLVEYFYHKRGIFTLKSYFIVLSMEKLLSDTHFRYLHILIALLVTLFKINTIFSSQYNYEC